ncbi:MAG: iron ABC transporter permease [Prevotella sp.]|nr:iron ABC transporter permease [Prevotella sp.]
MKRTTLTILLLAVSTALLFALSMTTGAVNIPASDVLGIMLGRGTSNHTWHFIVTETRLPSAVTAMMAGSSLAVSGLLLQTAFRNPLAGPGIFGISSGASVGVALVMLALGGELSAGAFSVGGFMAVLAGAFAGAMAVTAVIFAFSTMVRSSVVLLIIGVMIGYLASSAVTLLNFHASEEGVRSYVTWGMGTFGNTSSHQTAAMSGLALVGLALAAMLVKPLNAFLLGSQYARNLGINTRLFRHLLLVITGWLTAVATAFCGPIAFIGLAVPHIARLLLSSEDHRWLLPCTMLCGMAVALLCHVICTAASGGSMIPVNAVTPIIGAPVIIYCLCSNRFR